MGILSRRVKRVKTSESGQALLTTLESGQALLTNLQGGQALLIVLLAMAVILTVVLSITSRSVVDITTTSYQEDALRAFSAAEAGVEEVLLKQSAATGTLDPSANVTYNAQLSNPTVGNNYIYPSLLASGEIATFWFVKHDNTTNALTCAGGGCTRANQLEVCFGNNEAPAVEVSVYYDPSFSSFANPNNFANLKMARLALDSYNPRTTTNNFTYTSATNCSFGGSTFNHTTGNINLGSLITLCNPNNNPSCLIMAKVRILYNVASQPVGISVNGNQQNLPAQGFQVNSSGTSGESVRKLNIVRGYPELPSAFDTAVFSRNSLTKP